MSNVIDLATARRKRACEPKPMHPDEVKLWRALAQHRIWVENINRQRLGLPPLPFSK